MSEYVTFFSANKLFSFNFLLTAVCDPVKIELARAALSP